MVKLSLCLVTRKHSATLAESDRKGHRFKGQIEWIDAVLKMLAWTGKSFEIWPVMPVCMCVSISGVYVLSILRLCACAMITPDPFERNPGSWDVFCNYGQDSQDKTKDNKGWQTTWSFFHNKPSKVTGPYPGPQKEKYSNLPTSNPSIFQPIIHFYRGYVMLNFQGCQQQKGTWGLKAH